MTVGLKSATEVLMRRHGGGGRVTGGRGGSDEAGSHRMPGGARRRSRSAAVGEQACLHPDLGLLDPRTVRESVALVLSHPVCGQQPQETEALVDFILITSKM